MKVMEEKLNINKKKHRSDKRTKRKRVEQEPAQKKEMSVGLCIKTKRTTKTLKK
jgi:hypothetical protein